MENNINQILEVDKFFEGCDGGRGESRVQNIYSARISTVPGLDLNSNEQICFRKDHTVVK